MSGSFSGSIRRHAFITKKVSLIQPHGSGLSRRQRSIRMTAPQSFFRTRVLFVCRRAQRYVTELRLKGSRAPATIGSGVGASLSAIEAEPKHIGTGGISAQYRVSRYAQSSFRTRGFL